MPFVPHIVGDDDEMEEDNETLEPEPIPNESSPFVDSSEMDTSDSSDSSDDSDSSSDGDSDVGHANASAYNVEQKKERKEIVFKNQKDAGKEDTDDSDDDDDDDDDDEDDAMQMQCSNDITSTVGNAQEKGIENIVLVNETENADVAAPSIPVVENLPKFKSIFDISDPDDDDCEILPNNELRHEPVEINEITPSIESLPNIWLSNNTELASMQSPNRANSDAMNEVGVPSPETMNEVGVTSPEKMQQDLEPEPLKPIATVDVEAVPFKPIATVDLEPVPMKPIATVDLEPMDIEKENIEPDVISLDSDMDEELEMEELESPNKRAKPKPKATVKQNIIDPDEWLSAESRRMSLRSANKPSPVAASAATHERQRPTRPKPKANKVTKAKCVGPLGKHSASEAKVARPVVVTDYFRQVSATLVKNRVSLLPFLQLRKCVDELVTAAIKQTKNNNDSSPNF